MKRVTPKTKKTERNNLIIQLVDAREKSLKDIATEFGITRQRVHQIYYTYRKNKK